MPLCSQAQEFHAERKEEARKEDAYISRQKLFTVVDAGHGDLSLAHEGEVKGIG